MGVEIVPFTKLNAVPVVEYPLPSSVPENPVDFIMPVVICPPLIVVVPADPKLNAFVPSDTLFADVNVTNPLNPIA